MLRTAFLVTVLASLALAPVSARAGESTPAPSSTPPPSSDTSTSAPAASTGGSSGGWLLGGATVGVGQTYFLGEIGWPGLNLSVLHGMSERFDLGGTFSFVYGMEGVPQIAPGLKLNAILKLNIIKQAKFNFGLRLNPGIAVYFPTNSTMRRDLFNTYRNDRRTMFGIQFPLEFLVGIPVISSLAINVGVSMPMMLFLTPEVDFVMPIQPGFGLEYKVDNSLMLTLDTRYGASIFVVQNGPPDSHTEFAFRVQFGIGYRF